MVILAGLEDKEKPSFRIILLGQIKELRKQIDQNPKHVQQTVSRCFGSLPAPPPRVPGDGVRPEYLTDNRLVEQARIWDAGDFMGNVRQPSMPGEMPSSGAGARGESVLDRRVRAFNATVSNAFGRSFVA